MPYKAPTAQNRGPVARKILLSRTSSRRAGTSQPKRVHGSPITGYSGARRSRYECCNSCTPMTVATFPMSAPTNPPRSNPCSISSVGSVTHVLPWGAPLTYADLQAMPDDGHRYELIDGVLIVNPSPRRVHQRAVSRLLVLLHGAAPPEIEVLTGPFDYVVSNVTVLVPDIVVANAADYGERNIQRTPLLVIEVLS